MADLSDAYMKLNVCSSTAQRLFTVAEQVPNDYWVTYYNFKALPIPKETLLDEPLIADLVSVFPDLHTGVLKMEPNTCYNWHTDTDRAVGINMRLNDAPSHCWFTQNSDKLTTDVREIDYELGRYYVFNTKIPHIVFNGDKPRYLFSLELLGDHRGVTFDELCATLRGMNYGN